MNRDPGRRELEEERARAAVRGLGRVTPDPEFRDRLKQDFVSGRLDEKEIVRPPARRIGWWAFAPVAAAAVLLLVLFAREPRAPAWTVHAASRSGVRVDGRELPPSALEPGRALPTTGVLRTNDGWLEMSARDILVVRLEPGSEVTLPESDRRERRDLELRLARGEILFLTGAAFPGTRLAVSTPEGRIEVTGTAFAVYRDDEATCVCVLEGAARVGIGPDDMETIVPGKRKVMFGDGRAPKILDIVPQHRAGLEGFVRRVRSAAAPATP